MELKRFGLRRVSLIFGLLLLTLPLASFAACDEDTSYTIFPSHIHIVGTCSTQAESLQACENYRAAHNYPEGAGYCHWFTTEDQTGIEAGWLKEDYITNTYPPFYLVHFYSPEVEKAKPDKNAGSPRCREGCFGDPVNAGTGNKFETHREYQGAGVFPLELSWTYNSQGAPEYIPDTELTFGRNRTHSYESRIAYFSWATVPLAYLTRPDGKVMRFKQSGADWVADADNGGRLHSVTDAGTIVSWEFEDERGNREVFDAVGRLVGRYTRSGHHHAVAYDGQGRLSSVTDSFGRIMSFEYNTANLAEKVRLPDGSEILLFYGAAKDLSRVEYPGGASIVYLYDEAGYVGTYTAPGALTGVIDESQIRYSSTTYNDNTQATSTSLAGGIDMHTATYQLAPNGSYALQSTVTLPSGVTRQTGFTVVHGVVLPASVTTSCAGCQTATTTRTYDDSGHSDLVTDPAGTTTDYDYNARGLVDQTVDSVNKAATKRTVQSDWHPVFSVPTERRTYDSTSALVSKQAWTYNTRGQVLTSSQVDPTTIAVRTATTTYCEQADIDAGTCPLLGLVKSVDGPRTDVSDIITYTYYASDGASCTTAPTTCPHRKGDLWKVTNALNHVTETLRYDGAGRVLSTKAPTDVVTDLEYHPRGWLTARKVRGNNNGSETDDVITHIEYWPTGLVKKVTQPDGAFTAYIYDVAHRLTDISDNEGNTIHYTLDNAGNRTNEDTKDDQGTLLRTLSQVYNQLGQLETQQDAYQHATDYTYDANGNTDTITDALTRVTDNDYDPLNRLSRTLQDVVGISAETKFEYDALDNLTKVTDPKGLDTDYSYNGFGDLIQLSSPDTGITDYTYDSAGNRQTQTDARGMKATYSYDVLNRLAAIVYSDGSAGIAYTYDGGSNCGIFGALYLKGRLGQIIDASGTTSYCYDRFGNLISKKQVTNGKTFKVDYTYTLTGQLSQVTYPNGLQVDYVRDAQGRTTEVGITPSGGARQVLLREATYYPFGPVAEWTYGNGRLMRRSLNQNYQPGFVEDPFAGGISLGYEFNAVGNLDKLRSADQSDPPQRKFVYDGLNRLAETRDGATDALLQAYAYDDTGNRTSTTDGGVTKAYAYPADSHRLVQVGSTARGYDAAGNTTTIGGTFKQFTYNAANRMSQARVGIAGLMNYAYNGKGEQVRKYRGTSNTYTVYDESGHWLGDYDTTGVPIQQAIWLDDLPVGLTVGSANQLHYIEPDMLGTPRVVIDTARDVVVWRWELAKEAFGDDAPDADADGDGANFVFDMRFPGQRYDAASGLSQNGFRDGYEAQTGQYSQPDPLGQAGGIGIYGYAAQDPLNKIDQTGAATVLPLPGTVPFPTVGQICLGGPLGAIVCGGAGGYAAGTLIYPHIAQPLGDAIDKVCRDDPDRCYNRWQEESAKCVIWGSLGSRWVRACRDRARYRFQLCVSNGGTPDPSEPPEWSPNRDYPR